MTRRVLAVDCDPGVLTVLRKRLESAGYDVSTAADGFEALRKAYAERPDLILLDVIMANLNGLQVCTRLKSDPSTRNIPIVMMTENRIGEPANALRAGANAALDKPYEGAKLLRLIEELLRRADEERASSR